MDGECNVAFYELLITKGHLDIISIFLFLVDESMTSCSDILIVTYRLAVTLHNQANSYPLPY
jgi:hypothetical protein